MKQTAAKASRSREPELRPWRESHDGANPDYGAAPYVSTLASQAGTVFSTGIFSVSRAWSTLADSTCEVLLCTQSTGETSAATLNLVNEHFQFSRRRRWKAEVQGRPTRLAADCNAILCS